MNNISAYRWLTLVVLVSFSNTRADFLRSPSDQAEKSSDTSNKNVAELENPYEKHIIDLDRIKKELDDIKIELEVVEKGDAKTNEDKFMEYINEIEDSFDDESSESHLESVAVHQISFGTESVNKEEPVKKTSVNNAESVNKHSGNTTTPVPNHGGDCKHITMHHFNLDTECIVYEYHVKNFDGCTELCKEKSETCKYFNYAKESKSCTMSCKLSTKFPSTAHGAYPNGGEQDAGTCVSESDETPKNTTQTHKDNTTAPVPNHSGDCKHITMHHFSLDTGCIMYKYHVEDFEGCTKLCKDNKDTCTYFNYAKEAKSCQMSCELSSKFPSTKYGAFPNGGEQDAGICDSESNETTPTNNTTQTHKGNTTAPVPNQSGDCKHITMHHFNLDTECIIYKYNVKSFDGCTKLCKENKDTCKYFNYAKEAKSCQMSCKLSSKFPSTPSGAYPNGGEQDAGTC